jgi:hypothetical protein
MSDVHHATSHLHEVVGFLTAALERIQCIPQAGSGSSILSAASALSNACEALKPQLVRLSIVMSSGPAPPSVVESFCSSSLPELSAVVSSVAAIFASADEVHDSIVELCA